MTQPQVFGYEIWLQVMRRLVDGCQRVRAEDDAVDLTAHKKSIRNVASTSRLLRRALFQQFVRTTTISINVRLASRSGQGLSLDTKSILGRFQENRVVCSSEDGSERYVLDAAFLGTLIHDGTVRLTSVSFGDDVMRCLRQSADFIEDIVASSESFLNVEAPLQSLLRFCITPGGPAIVNPDAFLAECQRGSPRLQLDSVRVLLTSSMLWFNKRAKVSSTRRNCGIASLTPEPCASKLYRLVNLDARELELNFALIEEDEFLDFVELLWSDPHDSHERPPINAPSTTSFKLIDEFILSPSDLRIPVREYGRLIDFALAHMPNLTELNLAIDCLYRSGATTPTRVMRNNLAKIADRNVELVNIIGDAINGACRAHNLTCSVSYVLRGKRVRDFAQPVTSVKNLIDSHELFKMMGGVERNELVDRLTVKTAKRDSPASPPLSLSYCMEFQFAD